MKVNMKQFSEFMKLNIRTVGRMIEEGMPVDDASRGRGRAFVIDSGEAVRWWSDREHRKKVGTGQGGAPEPGTTEGEELLLLSAKRKKAEIEVKKAESSVIELEDVSQFLYSIATIYGNELNGLGARLAAEVVSEDDPAQCKNIIDIESRRVRAATADRIGSFVDEYISHHGRNDECTTASACGGLGEQ